MRGRPFSSIATAAALCCLPFSRGFLQQPNLPRTSSGGRRAFAGGRGTRMMVKIEDILKNPKWPGAFVD